jgi:hypothetical protein
MAKLWQVCKSNRKESKHNKRFYSSRDMSELKHMEAIKASEIKRGIRKDYPNNYISVCGCGHEGCFILGGYDNPIK